MIFGREPAVFLTLVGTLVELATHFGMSLTEAQHGAVMAAVGAVVAFAVRQSVSPVAHQ